MKLTELSKISKLTDISVMPDEIKERKLAELSEPGRILLGMWEDLHNPQRDELGRMKELRKSYGFKNFK
mgnify:CR=1 FL=1